MTKFKQDNRTREKRVKKQVDDGYFLYSQGLRTTIVLILFLEGEKTLLRPFQGSQGYRIKVRSR